MQEPLVFTPLLKVRVWGGEALSTRAPNPPTDPVGETWEIADHGEDSTVVRDGTFAGKSVHTLIQENPAGLCGEAVDPSSPHVFPLMLKLIDPKSDLSVQVHPDDTYAGKQQAGELGKTEAWYVLEAEPGAVIYRGLVVGTTKEDFAAALESGEVTPLLHPVPVRAGDVAFLPAGTIHALGAGVKIAEIQQNSDTTYRVFDWNRVGLDGTPRELHIEHALAVSDFSASDAPDLCIPEPLSTEGCSHERFAICEKFAFERLHNIMAPVTLDTEGKRFHILTVAEGSATVKTTGGTATLGRWDSVLVPADAGSYTLTASENTAVLLFYRP